MRPVNRRSRTGITLAVGLGRGVGSRLLGLVHQCKESAVKKQSMMLRLLAPVLMLCSAAVLAQTRVDIGKREYDNNCVTCHGADGKGTGAYADFLKRTPPDLTTMTRRNGGVFPISSVYAVIEGAGQSHGTRDMPIWGQDYRLRAADYYVDVPYDPEVFVRGRILALAEYLNRLQAK